ncbi:hypothetical protein [Streptomyces noursei]|uniref:hypothetical protein n=1 Tax=Streptomyces noursei TaxID=1971 RepID=UPI001CA47D2E|nr:hypothetical protein [Streptomyces noursei]
MLLGAFLLTERHSTTLCQSCVVEFRTDAAEYAQGRKWRFTAIHKLSRPVLLIALIGMMATMFLHGPWTTPTLAIVWMSLGGTVFLFRFHGAYQPWCPYCESGGGRGEREDVPAPDPAGGRGTPLPIT